jgi:spore germination cell wall hydrolase CwlJ-like protein
MYRIFFRVCDGPGEGKAAQGGEKLNDFEALTRIIWGEAEAENLSGKMGVGASVINQGWAEGKSLLQVIETPGQFEAFSNQRFWRAPIHTREPMVMESRLAAVRVLDGEDPTGGKTHFCAYQKDPCRWHYRQTPPVLYLGNHIFIRSQKYFRER